MTTDCNESGMAGLGAARGSAADVIRIYVVEYEYRNQQWRTVVEARDIEAAKRQFQRDNPDADLAACYQPPNVPVSDGANVNQS